jgi:hypothetical protein
MAELIEDVITARRAPAQQAQPALAASATASVMAVGSSFITGD